MFVYFMGQSGFGNRMMSLVSALWLCILAKIPKIVILEEPCAWCPGSVNGVFELPAHMRTVGIQSIELVTLTKENRDSWLNWADEMCADRKAVPLRMFHHPRFTPKYVLAAMDRQHDSPHVALPPMLWVQQKAVRIANAEMERVMSWLKEVAAADRNASGINDPELLLIGVHLRKTDMIDVMVRSGQTTYRTIDDQIADLLWQVATEIKTWAGACGAIVMLAADSLKGRLEATLQLYECCTMLEVTEDSCTHIYSCSCIKQADGTWTGIDACAQHWDTKRGLEACSGRAWKTSRRHRPGLREGRVHALSSRRLSLVRMVEHSGGRPNGERKAVPEGLHP